MKRKAPAFQLYADDFLAGTIDMSAEEAGVYIRLLCMQWTRGVVTERAAKSTGGSSDAISYVLSAKFEQSSDGFRNRRLEEVRRLSEVRAEAASKGGSKTAANREANTEQSVSKTPSKTQPSISVSISDSSSIFVVDDRWETPEKEFLDRVFNSANRIAKHRKTLDRIFVWRACWVGEWFDVEALDEAIIALSAPGVVKSPKGFLASAMLKICQRHGCDWDDVKKKVPDLARFAKPVQAVAPEAVA